ncbi:hypothetical protein [Corallococcus macrosporus]|uniref:Uncharacterized protein n=1 Tax=Corallococcus macrosporus DSM 14697 TaxID=1189310 RepID=A0A250JQ94_9BACT|nr:hypothetical protein [Corallococcus macrosporus]ATB45662.1 hypothetical protein MYMAC_001247 [Corallococcus macrosporus DSM 14697]
MVRGAVARSFAPLLLVLAMLAAARAPAAEWEGALRGSARLLLDTNAPRDYSDRDTPGAERDFALSLLGAAEGRGSFERAQLVGRYELGARKYVLYQEEDTLVQSGAVEASHALGTSLGIGLEGHAKDRRGGSRSYSDLGTTAFLEYAPDVRLALRVRAGARRFVYRPDPTANFGGPEVGVLGRYRFDRRHSLSVFGDWNARRFGTAPRARPPGAGGSSGLLPGRRQDGALTAGASYTYRGPVALGLTYAFQELSSNSYGETLRRHRVSANAGVRLPWRVTLLAQGSLGLTQYPDGIYLSPEIILVEEDEGQNSLSAKLARPLTDTLDLEASWGIWSTRLPRNALTYTRQVFSVGFTWRY